MTITIRNETTHGGGSEAWEIRAPKSSGVVIKQVRKQAVAVAVLAVAVLGALLSVVPAPQAEAQALPTWGQLGPDVPGRAANIALSGDGTTLIVGDDVAGVVRSYRQVGGVWTQFGNTIDPGSDAFGIDLAIDDDGDTIVVASRGNGGGISDVGRVYRFDGVWNQVGRTVISTDLGILGSHVDISSDGTVVAFHIRVVTADRIIVKRIAGGDLLDVGDPVPAGPAVSGVALSGDGNLLGVSSLLGGSQVHRLLGDEWEQVNSDMPSASDIELTRFGGIALLAFSSDNVARVYRDVGGNWVVGSNLNGEFPLDAAGAGIAMSDNGNVIAVGAPGNDGAADNAGHVRIYELQGALWRQAAVDIDGSEQAELFGLAVAMDSAGTRIAAGAPSLARVYTPTAAQDDAVTILAAESTLVDVLANDGAPQGATVTVTSQPAQATANVEGNQIRYEPGISTSTTDDFTYELCVGSSCTTATVVVTITPPTCMGGLLAPQTATVWGTFGPDQIIAGDGDDVIVSFGGDDIIDAGHGENTICAGSGDDTITTGDAKDWIRGEDGDDVIAAGRGIDWIFGGNGNDTIDGQGGSDRIAGSLGDDTITGGSGADRVWAGPGNDTVTGNGGKDTIWAGSGNDIVQGNHQSDVIRGESGNDTLRGAQGKDKLYGDAGDDLLFGGDNTDYLEGGPGFDAAFGQRGKDNPLVPDVSGCDAETQDSC